MIPPLINADDAGLTAGADAAIRRALDAGALTGISVLMTGANAADALRDAATRPNIDVGLHLDLLEGWPVSDPEYLPDLVGRTGAFRHSFTGLAAALAARPGAIRSQIAHEVTAQLDAFARALPKAIPVRLDGHRHVHLLPGVLDAAVAHTDQVPLRYVRLPVEPPRWPASLSANGLKQLVLAILARRGRPALTRAGIAVPETFLGLAHAGSMATVSDAVLAGALRGPPPVEIVFHPGRIADSELDQVRYTAFHASAARERELARLLRAAANRTMPFAAA